MDAPMDALALLRLQIEWGADEALFDAPVDRLRPLPTTASGNASAPGLRAVPAATPAMPVATLVRPASTATAAPARALPAERAREVAEQAGTLAALRDAVAAFDGCALRETASHLVFAEGDPAGRLLLIGEPPGEAEDRSGQPFAGAEGVLLDKMLATIGLERAGLLVVPLIPWRPPGGRPPNQLELATCLPFLHRLIVLAAPTHVTLFGTLATRTLVPGRRRAGMWTEIAGPWGTLPALALPGMSALLKTPALRRDAWAGLRLLRRALDGAPGVNP